MLLTHNAAAGIGDEPTANLKQIASLTEKLKNNDETALDAAIKLLRKIGEPAIHLKDSDATVRSRANYALGTIGAESKIAVPQLILLLKDSDATVGSSAASALNKICAQPKTVVPPLVAVDKVEFRVKY